MIVSPSLRSAKFCHNSSVMKGINGCIISKSVLKIFFVASNASAETFSPRAGFTISKYQEQKSSQTSLYVVINASDKRYFMKLFSNSINASPIRLRIQFTARASEGLILSAPVSHIPTKRKAFQTLLAKKEPCAHKSSSKSRSFPAGAVINMPTRTPSAPYCAMRSNGSGLLPNCLDILRRFLSRTIPVKYTSLKGRLPLNSYPAIIIRATQKKIMSCPVTKVLVG